MTDAKTMDELALECVELLEKDDFDGTIKLFGQLLMSSESRAVLEGNPPPHFGNGLLPDDDW